MSPADPPAEPSPDRDREAMTSYAEELSAAVQALQRAADLVVRDVHATTDVTWSPAVSLQYDDADGARVFPLLMLEVPGSGVSLSGAPESDRDAVFEVLDHVIDFVVDGCGARGHRALLPATVTRSNRRTWRVCRRGGARVATVWRSRSAR